MIIASDPYINELKQKVKLLIKWLLEPLTLSKKKAPAKNQRPKGQPRRNPIVEPSIRVSNPEIVIEKEEVMMSITETTSKIYELES